MPLLLLKLLGCAPQISWPENDSTGKACDKENQSRDCYVQCYGYLRHAEECRQIRAEISMRNAERRWR
jgi:hypothetical protein